jgi:hypothetical protein
MNHLAIHDWDEHQTYRKDRGQPPWIKVHRHIMRNLKWVSLDDAERGQLVAMWLLAADHNGVIPASPQLVQKLCFMSSTPNLEKFIQLGFLDGEWRQADAKPTPLRRQDDALETETEADTETDTSCASAHSQPTTKSRFEEFWAAYPKKAERKKAASAWKRRNLDRLADRIIEDVQRRQVMDRQWLDGFIPHPTTYLNGDRWEDEIQTAHKANGSLRIPDGDGPEVRSALWALCKEAGISADEVTAGTPLDAVRRMILERHPMRAAQ